MPGYLYMIQPGDTLANIAQQQCGNAALVDALAAMNHLEDPNLIFAGANLIIDCEALMNWSPGSTPQMPGPNPDGTYG
jgi:hypothetical protein